MNNVEVNEAALLAEAERAVAAAPVEDLQPVEGEAQLPAEPQASPEEIKEGYSQIAAALVGGAAETFAPNWAVQPVETKKLADAIAGACLLWFPNEPIPPKYLSLIVVAGVAIEIVAARRDEKTGKLRPLHANAKQESTARPVASEAV